MCVCMCVSLCESLCVHVCVCVCVRARVCGFVRMHTFMHVRVCVSVGGLVTKEVITVCMSIL